MSSDAAPLSQQSLLPIVITWALPFAVTLSVVSFSLSLTGWSPLRLEAILAKKESISDSQYQQIAPVAVLSYRLACLSPMAFLALLGWDIMANVNSAVLLGGCILLVGPSLLLLGWAALRARFCRWHLSWPLIGAAAVGAACLLAAQLIFALVTSTPFFSFSIVFLGLSAVPIAFAGEVGFDHAQPPLLSLRAAAKLGGGITRGATDTQGAAAPGDPTADAARQINRRAWLQLAAASYLLVMVAYAGVGAVRRDVAPYAAAAAAACVLVFDVLAFALCFQGAIREPLTLLLLCS